MTATTTREHTNPTRATCRHCRGEIETYDIYLPAQPLPRQYADIPATWECAWRHVASGAFECPAGTRGLTPIAYPELWCTRCGSGAVDFHRDDDEVVHDCHNCGYLLRA